MNPYMTRDERAMVTKYHEDPSSAYSMTGEELQYLLSLVGEDEPIIDAILKNSGATKAQRAAAIGLRESDFDYEDENQGNYPILRVNEV